MGGQIYDTPLSEMAEQYRPHHQIEFPVWETRGADDVVELNKLRLPNRLGYERKFVNGEKFAIAKNGDTVITPGLNLESVITKISETNITKAVPVLSSVIIVEVGTTVVAKDQFMGGRLLINGGTGVGHEFPIKGNEAGGGTAADTISVSLDVEMPLALATDTDVSIYTSPFNNLQLGSGGEASTSGNVARGQSIVEIGKKEYFWLKFYGPGIVQAGAAITVDTESQILKPAADGKVIPIAAHNDRGIATLMETADVANNAWVHAFLHY